MPHLGILILFSSCRLQGQEAQIGFEIPVTFTFGAMVSDRFHNTIPEWLATIDNPKSQERSPVAAGGRFLLGPTLKLGRNWYFHATVQGNTSPFFPYEAYHVRGYGARVRLIQGFGAYTTGGEKGSLTIKAGKLLTAFGNFATRYNDRDNALIDAPLANGSYVLLRPDLIPCSISDIEHQQRIHPNVSAYHCNHLESYTYGILPITPYGVFGSEVDVNWRRLDARVQLANSSPSNPQKIASSSQAAQWAAGMGATLLPGLRVGLSGFRGPWLQSTTQSQLDALGYRWRQFNASGIGLDGQWARSRLAVSGEWQNLRYSYPDFPQGPSVQYGYAEAKWTLHPRWFAAARIGFQRYGAVEDQSRHGRSHSLPTRRTNEFAVGFRPWPQHLLKAGCLWMPSSPRFGPRDDIFGFQWVIDTPTPSWTR